MTLHQALTGGLRAAARSGLTLTFATVAATHTSPNSVDLNIAGSTNLTPTVAYLSTYAPTVGDTVVVLEQATDRGPDYLVLGKRA